MKKAFLTSVMLLACIGGWAQSEEAESYFVTTNNVKKVKSAAADADSVGIGGIESAEEELDFIGKNFRYLSLCDWKPGMKFMVIPGKYDLVVRTFTDASTGKEVSSMTLRHKIMIYKGHSEGTNGHDHVDFTCQDDGKDYYYEIPGGSFEDHCYKKEGVPTLAYLGDVDVARDVLLGKQVFTESQIYYIDTQSDGEGFQEVRVDKGKEVTITSVGVGTRNYPVKIIVTDSTDNNREFFQYVAISRINSGMRDDEFVRDELRHSFAGSFRLVDQSGQLPNDVTSLIGKAIYTLANTDMFTRGDGKERVVKVPRLTEFKVDEIKPIRNSNYVTMFLTEAESRRAYFLEVTFAPRDVAGDDDGYKEKFFPNVFGVGEGKLRNTNTATRAMIREGRVGVGMNEDEVELALGVPDRKISITNGGQQWFYNRSKKVLIVTFGRNGKVSKYTAQ